jgi:hypothetical protein
MLPMMPRAKMPRGKTERKETKGEARQQPEVSFAPEKLPKRAQIVRA